MYRKAKGFTLIELLVVISIIALLIGILLPALGAARRTARQMQNNTQVRGIQQALVMFAQGNKGYYPGWNGTEFLKPADITYTSGLSGASVEGRFAILLESNFFAGDYMISPVETKTEWTTGSVTTVNYSYAMLRVNATVVVVGNGVPIDSGAVNNVGRRSEWQDTLGSQAIVVSDRLFEPAGTSVDKDDPTTHASIHTAELGDWRGSVAWNDNHIKFETTSELDTVYDGNTNTGDNIFAFDDDPSATGRPDATASMVTRAHNAVKQ